MRVVDVDDLPRAPAPSPSHRLVATGINRSPVHGGLDRILARYESDVAVDPHPHIGEGGLGALKGFDLGPEVVVPYIVEAEVADTVLIENDVGRQQGLEGWQVLADEGSVLALHGGAHVAL
jgi:hypothetical protein